MTETTENTTTETNAGTEQKKPRLTEQYDKFAARFQELFEASREKGREAMELSLEKAREQMTALGELSVEQAKLFSEYMKRDMQLTAEEMGRLGEEAKERLHPSRVGAGALASLASLLQLGGKTLLELSLKTKQVLTYKTGEITSAGTLTCMRCRNTMQFTKTSQIPPCPHCQGTTFRKGY